MKTKAICLISQIGYFGKTFSANANETCIFGTQDKCDDNLVMLTSSPLHFDFVQSKIKLRQEISEIEKLIK